jgi:pimeloyl-[acyl-carrier protein] synthase
MNEEFLLAQGIGAVAPAELEPFDPFQPEFKQDPYPFYRWYRERDPVHENRPGMWWVFRHADCVAMLQDLRFTNDSRKGKRPEPARKTPEENAPLVRFLNNCIMYLDPPEHTRLRSLIKSAFALRTVEQLQPAIAALANDLLDQVQGAGRMDLITDYSVPLSVGVVAELLGVPAADRHLFRNWSSAITASVDIKKDEDRTRMSREGAQAALQISAYFKEMAEERRRQPREDLMSALVQVGENGDRMSEDELVSMCGQLLIAGHETSANFLGNAMMALFRFPDQLALLQRTPELIAPAVDELLRYDSSVQVVGRIAREDVEIGGRQIAFGSVVNAVVGSANRDPALFADPDRLDITRGDRHYLSFGHGIHYCVGGALARIEAQIGLALLMSRMPNLAPATDLLQWGDRIFIRGLITLPLTF